MFGDVWEYPCLEAWAAEFLVHENWGLVPKDVTIKINLLSREQDGIEMIYS